MMILARTAAAAALALVATLPAQAQIVTETVEYSLGDMVFEGLVARNAALESSRGTVLIVHDWNGVDGYEQRRAEMLAAEGYTAFAIDLFGRDAVLEGIDDYRRETGALYGDRAVFRARLEAAIAAAATIPGATDRAVILGYCFGGAAVLEAARMGADLAGFVSFHGGLGTPAGQDWSAASGAPVLVLHGSADPVSGMADLAALMDELRAAGVPHAAEIFGGARHSFTVWGSNDYDLAADTGSWAALMRFLDRNL
jgi:dienelactone hydrolase